MIDVQAAVKIALNFIGDMYADNDLSDIRLEEVEMSIFEEGAEAWCVTIGFRSPGTVGAVADALGERHVRDYKVVRIDSDNGEVQGMTMREAR